MKWTHKPRTACFTVDASAPSNTSKETGPPMFTCRVRHWSVLLIKSYCDFLFLLVSCHVLHFLSTSDQAGEEFRELLEELLSTARACGVVLTPQEEFHLSLSQTVVLRHHWIQPLTQSLKAGLARCRRYFFG